MLRLFAHGFAVVVVEVVVEVVVVMLVVEVDVVVVVSQLLQVLTH